MSKGVIIMSKQLTEAQVLEKLNIPDFRHLSKDNVMSFASMIISVHSRLAGTAFGVTHLLKRVDNHKLCFRMVA